MPFQNRNIPLNDLKCPLNEVKDKRNDVDWNRCTDENSSVLGRCIIDCSANKECQDQCVQTFEQDQNRCPCEVNFKMV